MKNRTLSADYLERSRIRLEALKTLFQLGGYADVVREAQEVVELTAKSLLRFLGAEPARVHDVSAQLEEVRLQVKDQKQLDELIRASRTLRRDRELAFYGSEDLTPSEFYSKSDAKEAFDSAEKAVKFVSSVVKLK